MNKYHLLMSLILYFFLHNSIAADSSTTATPDLFRIYNYVITAEDIKELESVDLILTTLDNQLDIVYPDTSSMLNAIGKDLAEYPEAFKFIASTIRGKISLSAVLQDKSCRPDSGWYCPVQQISLDATSLAALKKVLRNSGKFTALPPPIISSIKELQGVIYPDSTLFQIAISTKIAASFGACRANIPITNNYLRDLKMDAKAFSLVATEWSLQSPKKYENALKTIDSLRNKKEACSAIELERADIAADLLFDSLVKPMISFRSQKYYPHSSSLIPKWKGNGCGCVINELNGDVYGFYPYWMVSKNEQLIDFSVISRIAYYGLTFDENGQIVHQNGLMNTTSIATDESHNGTLFIKEAKRHDTKVDWVIEKDNWGKAWASESVHQKEFILNELSNNIVELLTTKLSNPFIDLASTISYTGDESQTKGDGVTLYFRNYPTDSISTRLFVNFFVALKNRLHDKSGHYMVNLLMSQSDLERNKGIYSFKTFLGLLGGEEIGENEEVYSESELRSNLRSYLLVFLNEPSTVHKKTLRVSLDNLLQGNSHKVILRSLIPVLIFDSKNWEQFNDDLIYFNDTYYGLGIWPVRPSIAFDPATKCIDGISIAPCIIQEFEADDASHAPPSDIHRLVCLHRWGLRFLLSFSFVMLLLVGVISLSVCHVRHFIGKYMPLFVAVSVLPPMALFSLLLLFDPALAKLSDGNLPFIGALVLLGLGISIMAFYLKSQKSHPTRESLKAFVNSKNGK